MKGFRYNIDRCVACHACIAACQLENGSEMPWRTVLSESNTDYPGLPVHNISMACNHCEDAPCMEGCPVNAYYRHDDTGAVLINADRCIGCNYCVWNCPYDAPQYNSKNRTIEKCNLCFERVSQGIDPACVSACPTGALSFTEIQDKEKSISLIGDSGAGPSLIFEGKHRQGPVVITTQKYPDNQVSKKNKDSVNSFSEWSLILFSFLSALLFSINVSDRFGLLGIPSYAYFALCALTLVLPFFHLKSPFRAWRSLAGAFRSPLSTEILFLLLFIGSSASSYISDATILWTVSFIAGILLLIAIDNIYSFSDNNIRYHPGQVFIIALLITSFLIGEFVPFLFMVVIRLAAFIYRIIKYKDKKRGYIIFTAIYTIFYVYCIIALFAGHRVFQITIPLLILSELIIRYLYYYDFKPISLLTQFYNNNINEYEKEQTGK